jgi:UDP-N-acetylglucosamine 2-epimerase (non-hydrolysing)
LQKRILFIFGTRPEAIKLAPLILVMREDPQFAVRCCVTAQHRQMLDQVLQFFGITPDIDLHLMQVNQSLSELTARALISLSETIKKEEPDLLVVQGDTTTVLAASLAGYYHKVPIAHVEAGLRTHNKYSPFPEEVNRLVASRIADWHFAPTHIAQQNLLDENIPSDKIFVTGNTVIDALLLTKKRIEESKDFITDPCIRELIQNKERLVLITSHRRENFGDGIQSICQAILKLANEFPEVHFVYPVHLNPNIQEPVQKMLGNRKNVYLLPPLDYVSFVALMDRSYIVLTDSGGVQEEAPSLGKPILVMRNTTERPEAITSGAARLVGINEIDIYNSARKLLTDQEEYLNMSNKVNPYGDGKAALRILKILKDSII